MWELPERAKKALECCYSPVEPILRCDECPYHGSVVCKMHLTTDALVYIQQLEQGNAQKDERIRKLEREKKAMLRDMKAWPACDACKHRNLLCTQKPCSECREAGNGKTVMWEWRGVEEGAE